MGELFMLTFEKVLEVFKDYLSQDPDCEVVMTNHGYIVLDWNIGYEPAVQAQFCKTEENMKDILLYNYGVYLELKTTQGRRELTEQDKRDIRAKQNALMEKFET